MANYTRTRYEKLKSPFGTVREIFITVLVNNGAEDFNYGYWLTPDEVARVVADEKVIATITDEAAQRGLRAQGRHIATRSEAMPTTPPVGLKGQT